jgi:site-specific recombinase XerD
VPLPFVSMEVISSFCSEHLDAREISRDRQRAQLRLIERFREWLDPRNLLAADGELLAAFLVDREDAGMGANTIRKERAMLLSFFSWAYHRGLISAEAQLSLRSTPTPAGSCSSTRPKPYTRQEIKRLSAQLDTRWPRLDDVDVEHRIARWSRGTGRYARIRPHAIRLQLEAIIALTLYCGLRPTELAASTADDLHPDNAYVVARKRDGRVRAVPYPDAARGPVGTWLSLREAIGPEHNVPWLALWAEPTCRQQMSDDSLSRVLSTYIGVGWSLIRLRQTCGICWLRAGLPIWHVQRLLGHHSIRDTLVYAEAVKADTHRAAERLHDEFSAELYDQQRVA